MQESLHLNYIVLIYRIEEKYQHYVITFIFKEHPPPLPFKKINLFFPQIINNFGYTNNQQLC